MNYKFKKRPVVIEAFQMTKSRRWHNEDWPEWLHEAWNKGKEDVGSLHCGNGGECLFINTLEGEHAITFSDFIIQGIEGELYPCKPDIFHKTYVEV